VAREAAKDEEARVGEQRDVVAARGRRSASGGARLELEGNCESCQSTFDFAAIREGGEGGIVTTRGWEGDAREGEEKRAGAN
jgi:hypothetical protein